MNSNSINDPAAVSALLEQLRASQAWQQLVNEQAPPSSSASPAIPRQNAGATVADLLAQLKTSGPSQSGPNARPWSPPATIQHPFPSQTSYQSPDLIPPAPDPRSCTFQEALPLLARLGDDPASVEIIKGMRKDQDALEKQIWTDREAIHKKYADKVKVAKNTASMVGTGISRHEANMLQDAYQKELLKFDRERVLPAWDGLTSRQQAQLESLGVPNMFITSDRKDKERQTQIIHVLLGLVGPE